MADFKLDSSSVVIVGLSGEGKSTIAKELTLSTRLKTFVIEGDPRDFREKRFNHLTYEEAFETKFEKCCIIYEDVSIPTESRIRHIRKQVVYSRRHHLCNVLLIIHSVKCNNISPSLLNQFMFVIFTKSERNLRNWEIFCKQCTSLSGEEASSIWKELLNDFPERTYLVFDLQNSAHFFCNKTGQKWTTSSDLNRSSSGQNSVASLRKSVLRFLPPENKDCAMRLFEYLFDTKGNISPSAVSPKFELSYKTNKVHLLDLLHYVASPNKIPTSDMICVFGHLQKKASIPRCLVLNERFITNIARRK